MTDLHEIRERLERLALYYEDRRVMTYHSANPPQDGEALFRREPGDAIFARELRAILANPSLWPAPPAAIDYSATVIGLTADELIRRAVTYPPRDDHVERVRWSLVRDMFGVGSTSSAMLCKLHGLNPDDMIGRGACPRDDEPPPAAGPREQPDGLLCSRCDAFATHYGGPFGHSLCEAHRLPWGDVTDALIRMSASRVNGGLNLSLHDIRDRIVPMLKRTLGQQPAGDRLTWRSVSDDHPPRGDAYLVLRDGKVHTCTVCYGMHPPWWIVRTMDREAEPLDMRPGDLWCPLKDALDRLAPAPSPAPAEQDHLTAAEADQETSK